METKPLVKYLPALLAPLAVASLLLSGCSGGAPSNVTTSTSATGPTFVVGTDAPLASVASFSVTVSSVVLNGTDSSGNTIQSGMITGSPSVDFARFNGLQTLLDMTGVQAGTYTSVTITLGSTASVGYLDTTQTPPAITTATMPLSSTSLTYTLDKNLEVNTASDGGTPVGLRMDLDLQKSIPVDSSGDIETSSSVTPTFHVNTVAYNDSRSYIDVLVGAVVTAPAAGSTTGSYTFAIDGPHGEQFTIDTTSSTVVEGGDQISSWTTPTNYIVLVSGQLDPADQTMDADEVRILSTNGFYADGLVTYATTPTAAAATGCPTSTSTTNSFFDLYVRALLPDSTGVQLGDLAQVCLTGSEKYSLYWMHNSFSKYAQKIFNQSSLVAGQEVAIGGSSSNVSSSAPTVNSVDRVTLKNWGYIGTVVDGSEDATNGSFQINVTGFAGNVISPQPITVYFGDKTNFRFGFGAFSDLTDGARVRVVGLLIKDPTTGNPVLLARHIDGFTFTNFDVAHYSGVTN
jgi:hypothetical protein